MRNLIDFLKFYQFYISKLFMKQCSAQITTKSAHKFYTLKNYTHIAENLLKFRDSFLSIYLSSSIMYPIISSKNKYAV